MLSANHNRDRQLRAGLCLTSQDACHGESGWMGGTGLREWVNFIALISFGRVSAKVVERPSVPHLQSRPGRAFWRREEAAKMIMLEKPVSRV